MAEPTAQHRPLPKTRGLRRPLLPPLDRARLARMSPLVVAIVAIALVAAGQVAEDIADSPPIQMLEPSTAVRRWTVIVAVVYVLLISRAVDRLVERSIAALRDDLEIGDEAFGRYAIRMRRPGFAVDLAILVASSVVVTALFLVLRYSLPSDDPVTLAPTYVPGLGPAAALILVDYTLVGWAVVSLAVCTVRRARALGALSREPLEVDVYDTSNLLPLGNIALATALAPAGIIVILLFGFGRPSSPLSWSILLLATSSSLLALLLPLWGTHRQMARAKHDALAGLGAQLREVHLRLRTPPEIEAPEMSRLNNRVSILVDLRKTVTEMTTWPFRDTLAFGRALLIASAPLIYTIATELIKIFWINPLRP